MSEPIKFYNRRTGTLQEEIILGDSLLRLAYSTPARHVLSWPLFGTALMSRILGWYANRGFSKARIDKTIESLHMSMDDYVIPDGGFTCFNDFFARRLKPGARIFVSEGLPAPADSRLLVYPVLEDGMCIPVKGASFSVSELLRDDGLASEFNSGSLAVFRLCPSDYHRYHFPDDGRLVKSWRIPGRYDSVSPLALEQMIRVFTSNVRQITLLELEHFGKAVYIEVGAFGVASITQTYKSHLFARGDEKGFFTFGGSTVILLLKKDAVKYDDDILEHSAQAVESLVRAGDKIADSLSSQKIES